MLVWRLIIWLRKRIQEQEEWIKRCGGDLAGYLARYGDVGQPPLDEQGRPQTVRLTDEQVRKYNFSDLTAVPDQPGLYYKPHYGAGGTLIYRADCNRLAVLKRELSELEVSCPAARLKADEYRKAEQIK